MPRKGRFGYGPGNTADDGHYVVGKGRPPEHGKFRAGDGRKRGRRPKGTKNLASDLHEELGAPVAVTVGGKKKKVTRQRAIVMRMADNATKGQTSAIALALELQQRLVGPMLQREQQRQHRQQDLRCLSDLELDALVYLTSEEEGLEEASPRVVGVIPIYRKGERISQNVYKEVANGLAAYGVKNHKIPALSFGPAGREKENDCAVD
jgi:hypothetical protein